MTVYSICILLILGTIVYFYTVLRHLKKPFHVSFSIFFMLICFSCGTVEIAMLMHYQLEHSKELDDESYAGYIVTFTTFSYAFYYTYLWIFVSLVFRAS